MCTCTEAGAESDRGAAWTVLVELNQVFTQHKQRRVSLHRSSSDHVQRPLHIPEWGITLRLRYGRCHNGVVLSHLPSPSLSLVLTLRHNQDSERQRRSICLVGLCLSDIPGRRKLKGMGKNRITNRTGERDKRTSK